MGKDSNEKEHVMEETIFFESAKINWQFSN